MRCAYDRARVRAREPNQNNIIILSLCYISLGRPFTAPAKLSSKQCSSACACCVCVCECGRVYKVFVFELIIIDFLQLVGIVSSCDDDQDSKTTKPKSTKIITFSTFLRFLLVLGCDLRWMLKMVDVFAHHFKTEYIYMCV